MARYPRLGSPFVGMSRSHADFDVGAARRPGGTLGYPEAWASRADLPIGTKAAVAALVHVYFPDLLDEIVGNLASIPVPFDVIVTNASGVDLRIDEARMPQIGRAIVLGVENRGRDLWPLVQVVSAGLLDGYSLIVKVHTKRSAWRDVHGQLTGTGGSWRSDLLSAVLGDAANVADILNAYASTPDLGIVTADGSVLGPEYWGRNVPVAAALLKRWGRELRPDSLVFAAGSMYWTRGGSCNACAPAPVRGRLRG